MKKAILATIKWILLILSILLGILSAFAGFLLGAAITSHILTLILLGLSVSILISFGLSWLVGKSLFRSKRTRIAMWISLSVAVAVIVISVFTIFKPLINSSEIVKPSIPPKIDYWELESGSRIAYQKIPAVENVFQTPVIFLHGGPGGSVVSFPPITDVISSLSENGYNVYFYDQIGGGRSGRLQNIREYTLSRHVEDLEHIRSKIGASRLILIGESHGGVLATHYAATHPENIEKLVLISPGELIADEWDEESSGNIQDRASAEKKAKFNRILKNPRILFAFLLLYINPDAAYRFLSEPEADTFATKMFDLVLGGMACDPSRFPADHNVLFGFWATIIPDEFPEAADQNVKDKIKSLSMPTLILKSECDYVKWAVTYEYKTLISKAVLLYLEGAGHMPFLEKPNIVLNSIRSFLGDQPLPLPGYEGSIDPRR
ncbi:alpha/beta fold hydrolase [Acidobacteriota bacterium]